MPLEWKLPPHQAELAGRLRALLQAVPPDGPATTLRGTLGDAGLLAPDALQAVGGGGRPLADAMTAAEVLGRELPRARSAELLDGAPVRLLGLHDHTGALLKSCVLGQATVGLLEAGSWALQLERRPNGYRLVGEVPATPVPGDAHHFLFVFRHGSDGLALALVPLAHVSLRRTPLPGLPLVLAQGLVDVEVPDTALVLNAPLEVKRALASEELVRAARAVGEAAAALAHTVERARAHARPGESATSEGQLVRVVADTGAAVLLARTALYAAAERMGDAGPHTLLGEETRLGSASAVMEARAVAHQALHDVAAALDGCVQVGFHATPTEDDALHAAFTCSRLDVAALAPVDEASGLWTRLGESRLGALGALHSHAGGHTTHRGNAESRTPLPADVPTPPPATAERKSVLPSRSPTSRFVSTEAEWGPLPFVPDEANAFRLEVRKLVAEQLYGLTAAVEREGHAPDAALELLAARGLYGITVDPERGGLGRGLLAYLATQEELGRAHAVFGSLLGGSNVVAALFLELGGIPALRDAHLPALATGKARCVLANALPEPIGEHQRSTLRVIRTHDDPETFVANGTLPGVVHADRGDFFILAAAAETAVGTPAGTVCAWLPKDTPGLSVRVSAGGALREGTLVLEGCQLPPAQLLGEKGHGHLLFARVMEPLRLDLAARALGMAGHGLELWRAALTGRSAATMAAHGRALGQLWARLASVRALLWATAMRLQHGESQPGETAAVKLLATELCATVLDQAVASAGAEAMAADSRLQEHLRHARGLRIRGGSSELQRAVLAASLLGEPWPPHHHHRHAPPAA